MDNINTGDEAELARKGTAAANRAAEQIEMDLVKFRERDVEIVFNFDISHETVWATQAQIAELFGRDVNTIGEHILGVYADGELMKAATSRKFRVVRQEGMRSVTREIEHYNLDVILSVGYRVSSAKATAFRQWATRTLRAYLVDGYALNEVLLQRQHEKLNALAEKVRALRSNERTVYEKVRDCFSTTASDYDKNSQETKRFFANLQNKFLYAATQQVAAEIILERADHTKDGMGLRAIRGNVPTVSEAQIAKNYLDSDELYVLHIICEQFLLFVESAAVRGKSLTMKSLSAKFDTLLATAEYPVFPGYKEALRDKAMEHARRELERYQVRVAMDSKRRRITSTEPVRP